MSKKALVVPPPSDETIRITGERLLHEQVLTSIELAKGMPGPWHLMGEKEQQNAIDRVTRAHAETNAQQVRLLASSNRHALSATVKKVSTSSAGIVVQLLIDEANPMWKDVADHKDKDIILVLADANEVNGEVGVKADPQQSDAFKAPTAAATTKPAGADKAKDTPAPKTDDTKEPAIDGTKDAANVIDQVAKKLEGDAAKAKTGATGTLRHGGGGAGGGGAAAGDETKGKKELPSAMKVDPSAPTSANPHPRRPAAAQEKATAAQPAKLFPFSVTHSDDHKRTATVFGKDRVDAFTRLQAIKPEFAGAIDDWEILKVLPSAARDAVNFAEAASYAVAAGAGV